MSVQPIKQKIKIDGTHLTSLKGQIQLPGSKSISNRVLIIRALCEQNFDINNLSDSDDTATLKNLLSSDASVLDAHHAGTTFRFLTAYLALTGKDAILTGSERMQQRPVHALVEGLRELGCNIEYLRNEGFPPIKIHPYSGLKTHHIKIQADISSQYISALLLIAPALENGLTIELQGEAVSLPYIKMTLRIMEYFGVQAEWNKNVIHIKKQPYIARHYEVEPDWSAASYYYSIAGLSDSAEIFLSGLKKESVQGDAAIAVLAKKFGVDTEYLDNGILIKKLKASLAAPFFEYNFIEQPDLVQSISVLAAGLGTNCIFSGLETLKIKETDRTAALKKELLHFGTHLNQMPQKFSKKSGIQYYMQEGKASIPNSEVCIRTYNDHRMAMCFAPLSLKFPLCIEDPDVVSKSYPGFWNDLQSIGFEIFA